jgi:hypothetical protein
MDKVAYSSTDKAYMVKQGVMPFAQLNNFQKFVDVIVKHAGRPQAWRSIQDELISPIARILQEMVNKSEMLKDMMYAFNITHRGLSLHTLTGLYDKNDKVVRREQISILEPAAFANIVFSVDPDAMMGLRFDNTFYHKSLSVHTLMSDVGDGMYIAKKYLKEPIFKMSERIEEAFKFVAPHPLKEWMLKEMVARKKTLPFEHLRPRSYISAKLDAADKFYSKLTPSLLSYSPSFIFSNGYEANLVNMDPTERYRILLLSQRVTGAPELDIQDLERLIVKGELARFLKDHPQPIRFNIPVTITSGAPLIEPINPLKIQGEARVEVGSIHVGFRDGDEEKRFFTDEFAMLMSRSYLVERPNWVDVPDDFPRTQMVHRMMVWSELDLGIELEYMHVRRR